MDKPPQNNIEKEVVPTSPEERKLIEARTKYAEAYKAFLAERKAERTGLQKLATAKEYVLGATIKDEDTPEELKKLEQEYDQAAVACGQSMFEDRKKQLEGDSSLSEEQRNDELKKFKQGEIYKKVIVEEQEILNRDLKAENLPPKEKAIWKKAVDWYLQQPTSVKLAMSFAVSGLFAMLVAPGSVAAAGGAAAYWGIKGLRTGASMGLAKMYDAIRPDKSAEKRETEKNKLAEIFGEETGEIDVASAKKEYAQVLEQEKKEKRNRVITKAAIGMAASLGTSYAMAHEGGLVGSAHADELDLPKHATTPENIPTQGTTPAQIDSLLKVRDSLIPHKVASIVAEAKPDSSSIANAQARLDTLKADFTEHGTHTPTSEAAIKIAEEELNNLKQNTTINIPPSTEDILPIREHALNLGATKDSTIFNSTTPTENLSHNINNIPAPKNTTSIFDEQKPDSVLDFGKPKPSIFPPIENTPINTFHGASINFEHGKGGIQGILDLKAQIKSEYPDISKAPQSVQDFMNTDATKEAIKLGFYNPDAGAESAQIQEGSVLKFDEKGNLLFGKPDATGNIPVLEKANLNMIDTDKPIVKPEPVPIPETELKIKPNIIDTNAKINLDPQVRTPEELKEMLEAKYAKNVPFNEHERVYDRPIGTETSKLQQDGLYKYDGVAPKAPEVVPAQILDAKTLAVLQNHPEFVLKNSYALSTQQLAETYNVHYQNINHLLPHDTAENWHDIGKLKAKDLLNADPVEQGKNMGPIVSYMKQLQAESGLKPESGLFGVGSEKTEHYMARALQKIEADGHLHKVALHNNETLTPVPKSPDAQHTQQTLQPETTHATQTTQPENIITPRHNPSIPQMDETGKIITPEKVPTTAKIEVPTINTATPTNFAELTNIAKGSSTQVGNMSVVRPDDNLYKFTTPDRQSVDVTFRTAPDVAGTQDKFGLSQGGKLLKLDQALPLKEKILENLTDKNSPLAQDLAREIAKNKEELEFLKEFKQ